MVSMAMWIVSALVVGATVFVVGLAGLALLGALFEAVTEFCKQLIGELYRAAIEYRRGLTIAGVFVGSFLLTIAVLG